MLENKVAELTEYKNAAMNTGQLLGPVEFTVPDYQKLMDEQRSWDSPRFYSHPLGYTMRLMVTPYGLTSSRGTHLSITFMIDRTDRDDMLNWPFRASISVQLVNQVGRYPSIKKRLKLRILKSIRHQTVQFIPHSELDDGYVKSDCIRLQLTELKFTK